MPLLKDEVTVWEGVESPTGLCNLLKIVGQGQEVVGWQRDLGAELVEEISLALGKGGI